jgi:hypothetical protein
MVQDFLKLGGGMFKNEKQKRTLKLHSTGELSYWKGTDLRGVIKFEEDTVISMEGVKGFYIDYKDEVKSKGGRRKINFEEVKSDSPGYCHDWIKKIKELITEIQSR